MIVATTVGVGAGLLLGHASAGEIATFEIVILSIGAMMAAFGRKIVVNRELHEAREELALLAVSEERLRIARDLHDLLGHSLSVIALKSELAGRLLERDPARASREIDDIQTVTRQALAEVREAVQGYRAQGLADALDAARSALRAAGIECELDPPPDRLPADVEAVLAWAVREGATNVVRHSGANRCSIRVRAEASRAAVEVEDNGASQEAIARSGSGLTGLAERAQGVHGTLEAGAPPRGRLPPAAHGPPGADVIRVLIAEDQAMVRGALVSLLSLEGDIEVVAEVDRGDAVLEAAERTRPDVALLDIEMPGQDGIAAAAELVRALPGTRVLILTTFGRPGYLRRALEQGASGFLLKDAPARELAAAVRSVHAGLRAVDPALAAEALAEGSSPLTAREAEVLAAAARHGSVADISRSLHLSEGTVRNYLSASMRKLGARNRGEAVDRATQKGWL